MNLLLKHSHIKKNNFTSVNPLYQNGTDFLSLPFQFLLYTFALSLELIFLLPPRYLQPNLP